jgi:hypothetical protein
MYMSDTERWREGPIPRNEHEDDVFWFFFLFVFRLEVFVVVFDDAS